jgi:RimJ/RimL family protein N-acetyltransferase
LSETQPAVKTSRVHLPGLCGESGYMSDLQDLQLTPRLGRMPPVTLGATETAPQGGDAGQGEIVVLTRALAEDEWDMVRAFVRGTSRESLRLRFGQSADLTDDRTLKRFFETKGSNSEMIWMLQEGGAICAIVHLARLSPRHAEIALIVRSDRAHRGIGEALLHAALARAARQGLRTLSAFVLHENTAMLRLARKTGFVPCKSLGLGVELEFDLGRIRDAGTAVAYAGATTCSIAAATS